LEKKRFSGSKPGLTRFNHKYPERAERLQYDGKKMMKKEI